ncbi:MAG: tRNA (guanosine(37)-N1)-methyltransferase TrmD [Candidatus Buchananbacteria bacterium]|nr:tRNA (guanosine(37)-N1)-methyltransferase TrmD [Candidatus Buchananbacteria bacterium]
MKFDIISIFPESFDSYFKESIIKRAREKKVIEITIHNLRDYSTSKSKLHRAVDDKPYGGGPGMILLIEPIAKALKTIKRKKKSRVIMLTPAGKKFTQREAERLAKYDQLILLCGRYEGFDARVDKLIDEKLSIGDYVLAGGELPAMVVTEAVARNIKGVVGHDQALKDETFSHDLDYIEYPQYSRPENFKGMKVPDVLLSGNHQKIADWRKKMAKKRKKS